MGHNHAHHPLPAKPGDERYIAARRVTVVGAVVNILLSVGKIGVGLVGGSPALVADGIHSVSDLLTDAMVIFAAKHGSRDADEEHPYGHGRIETIMTVALGVVLIIVALGIVIDATSRLFHPDRLTHPGMSALAMAAVSVISKEVLYQYTAQVARKIRSNMLRANAWHHRSDAISSIVVIIGIAGTMAGLPYLDSIAAVVVGIMVAKIGWDLGWASVHELIDTALHPERVKAIREAIDECDGVIAVHSLRTRRMGGDALVDVHIQVKPKLSVSEGHFISESVRAHLIRTVDEVTDVLVHIDPEDDESMTPSMGLPPRRDLLARLIPLWEEAGVAHLVEDITLHYLDGKLLIEVLLPLDHGSDETIGALKAPAEQIEEIRRIDVLLH